MSQCDSNSRRTNPLKLYINGRFLTQPVTGLQRFALENLRAIDRTLSRRPDLRNEFLVVVLGPSQGVAPNDLEHVEVRTVGRLAGHLWDQLDLAYYARGGLLLSLCNAGPILHSRHIVAIHDGAVFANAQNFSRAYRTLHGSLAPLLARTTKSVVTVSEFSRRELAYHYPSMAAKLRIVPNGSEHILSQAADTAILGLNGLVPGRYVLALGSLSPNKNVSLVIDAFSGLDDLNLRLAVAGGQSANVFSDNGMTQVPFSPLGYVSDAAVRALYENALCFVFPSFYEGFGIPPLEAMLCGCPVIVSDIPALRETCGDDALFCDPHDPQSLVAQIRAVASDPQLRDRLRERGLARARRFTWDRSAEMLLDVVRDVRDRETGSAGREAYWPARKLDGGTL